MRKTHIILTLIAIPLIFTVLKVSGEERKTIMVNTASISEVLTPSLDAAEQIFIKNESMPEVLPQSPISAPSGFSSSCNSDLTTHLGLAKFLNQSTKIFELNPDNRWPIASIIKLLTATIALENFDSNKIVAINENMVSAEGTAGEFKINESFKIKDLIKAMLLVSSNDAAEAIAQDFGRDNFVKLMNQKAKELNMTDTFIYDPSGLSSRNQSTPNDIFKLVSYIDNNHPEILKITRTKKDYIIEQNSGKNRALININEFAGQANFIGGKTGYTDEAQGNLVSVFDKNGEILVIVVLGSQDRFGETMKLLECAK